MAKRANRNKPGGGYASPKGMPPVGKVPAGGRPPYAPRKG